MSLGECKQSRKLFYLLKQDLDHTTPVLDFKRNFSFSLWSKQNIVEVVFVFTHKPAFQGMNWGAVEAVDKEVKKEIGKVLKIKNES